VWRTTTVPGSLVKGRAFLVLFSTAPQSPEADAGRVSPGSILRKVRDLMLHSRWDRALRPIR
jgi:hypothetical protein